MRIFIREFYRTHGTEKWGLTATECECPQKEGHLQEYTIVCDKEAANKNMLSWMKTLQGEDVVRFLWGTRISCLSHAEGCHKKDCPRSYWMGT